MMLRLKSLSVKQKFSVGDESIRIVCSDGCEVDDDEGLHGLDETNLFFLKENEKLTLPSSMY